MDEGMVGLIVFLSVTLVCAFITHICLRNITWATEVSTLFSALIFQMVNLVMNDNPEPFIGIAVIFSLIYAFLIALLVGIPFHLFRRKRP
ncbi:hypothetical protein FX988_00219 [Paraglaciecola mesophila]|uniref:Uncharacterized protein n=1 Tax=Paraglaciecola mesophila TaxID=197222 RepID=A0A857JFL6_9ALTE|nr:hypothetical protein [Paraglaciecola mesophila]QHJ10010.1 hypothetical protein FX988_00219 [Paraglaciecola mesophila]